MFDLRIEVGCTRMISNPQAGAPNLAELWC
jgi:hypothetical protein